MTSQQLNVIGHQLISIGAIWHPGTAAAVAGLLDAATELNTLIQRVRDNDPEAWAAIERDYSAAAAAFRASVAK